MTNDTKLILQKMDEVRDDLRNEFRTEMGSMRDELRSEMGSMRDELRDEFRTEMGAMRDELRSEMGSMRDDLRDELLTVMGTIRDDLQRQITSINLTLENDIKRSINLIAEGHLDLSRKLDEALKVEREKEMFLVRFNTVENDVRILKAQVAQLI